MTCRRRGNLCLLSDRQAEELLESLDVEFDTDDEIDPGGDFVSDDEYYNDPEIEVLFSPPAPSKRRKEHSIQQENVQQKTKKVVPLVGPGAFTGSADKIDPTFTDFKNIKWRKGNLLVREQELLFDEPELEQFKSLDTPFKCFSYFVDGILEYIADQTNLYAKEKNIMNRFCTTAMEIRKYFGILLYMSVFRYPSMKSYWSEYAFLPIRNTMNRNRCDEIRYLHFNDNGAIPSTTSTMHDRLHKIQNDHTLPTSLRR